MNIIDFVLTRKATFEEEGFDYMDAIVFSQLCYGRLEEAFTKPVRLRELFLAEFFDRFFCDGISDRENMELLAAASASRRYRDVVLTEVVATDDEETFKQFAAIAFELGGGLDCISFRGTDGTINGWKEDCKMAFSENISSQQSAVEFVQQYNKGRPDRNLILTGHSKGGNLAVYAAAYCGWQVQDQIDQVYCLDGPGFLPKINQQVDALFEEADISMYRIIPYGSIVGMLLDSSSAYKVVKSTKSGIMQHSVYTWIIENGDLAWAEGLSTGSLYLDRTMRSWFEVATEDQREVFFDMLFEILEKNNISVVSDFKNLKLKDIRNILAEIRGQDEETAKVLEGLLISLIKTVASQMGKPKDVTL